MHCDMEKVHEDKKDADGDRRDLIFAADNEPQNLERMAVASGRCGRSREGGRSGGRVRERERESDRWRSGLEERLTDERITFPRVHLGEKIK